MKKLIALCLALLLLVSALPLAGAAFKDEGFIAEEHQTAVAKMSEQGIINGFEDGSFGPKKTLTRAQAAKILCVMLEGAEKANALTKAETGFADVPATHWAAKFVAYCVEKGIVSGVGDGKFDPDGKLTDAAFAKMLLVAIGEDGTKFTGADWLKNVQEAAAPSIMLFRLGEKLKNGTLERQKAAQMAYNAQFIAESNTLKTQKDISGKLPTSVPESIKILALGNSYSNDCILGYLYPMLKSVGVKDLTIGNMYHSGCSVQMHLTYALANEKGYQYYKRTEADGKWKSPKKNSSTLDDALNDIKWDIITFQAGSGKGEVTCDDRTTTELLASYVQRKQPQAIFGWNFTWAEAAHSKRESFKTRYGGDRMKQYEAMIGMTKTNLKDPRFQFQIPVGTAIQNARTSFIGDHMDRDGYHLNKGIGRYIASMVWTCKLTGVDPDTITYLPEAIVQDKKQYSIAGLDMTKQGLLEALGKVARESVKNALANPYEVTQSQYKTAP